MKKNSIALALSVTALFTATNVMAYDGTVNFVGQILDTACTVDIGANNTLVVDMGNVYKTAFAAAGDEASTTKFTLRLINCPASVSTARVKFDGANDASDSTLLAIMPDPAAADGVAIRLKTADKTNLDLNQVNGYTYVVSSTMDNNLDFYAAYVATRVPVMAGPANAVANFTVNYN
ncbi:fimbrial protein [Citrobacter rodentium]|jgi:P pilus assembly protein, pilin FimA|uniref:Major fimbrial subunit n=2 Tax=Citrobacter rodentium TaxID=67825 RepID=D2TLZ6_CITRI|nr:fimbrial protein [Citrobacter rodentium]KIQ50750.1 ferrous iron transporter B [Citrobacter rodentium]QBY28374.1 type 1 fimbrial protein [Citrobacter rodentium]UHO29752.1 fimbrial protein [Citrobacter rodentium NBRC 105723 = DSM 16636]CBG88573.1 putative major fimbrial subunit [Citrobacter rodentium ICC168]HAT8012712.1 type 1 fimbrial protein [Citrobacter rodentium NBRC 105723 = DSM 16636]